MNKSPGTKTAHVNHSLRLSVYSGYLAATGAPAGRGVVEALMTHLADTTPPPCRRPLGANPVRSSGGCHLLTPARRPISGPRHAGLVSRSCGANFLEFIRAGFHYSVIVRDGASRAGAERLRPRSCCSQDFATAAPCAVHREMMDGASNRSRQFRLRTGDRRIDAQRVRKLVFTGGHKRPDRESSVMRFAKNIPATLPSCATIAPILHAATHVTPEHRGITLNTGAADADGR